MFLLLLLILLIVGFPIFCLIGTILIGGIVEFLKPIGDILETGAYVYNVIYKQFYRIIMFFRKHIKIFDEFCRFPPISILYIIILFICLILFITFGFIN